MKYINTIKKIIFAEHYCIKTKYGLYLDHVNQKGISMKLSTQIKPISYLKNNTAEVVREINQTGQPMLITQNGEAKLVVLDVASFEEYEETLAMLKLLSLGQKEIDEKQYRPAEEVFADLEKDDE